MLPLLNPTFSFVTPAAERLEESHGKPKRRERLALNPSQNEREAIEGGTEKRKSEDCKVEDYRTVKINDCAKTETKCGSPMAWTRRF